MFVEGAAFRRCKREDRSGMGFRSFFPGITLFLIGAFSSVGPTLSPAFADYEAGVSKIAVPAQPPFDTLVVYPADQKADPWQAGPFTLHAGRDVPVSAGRFPVVILSHGGGRTGGSPMILLETATALAKRGFIVIAPFHGKTRLPARLDQLGAAFETVASMLRLSPHLDAERLGVLGFSLGTAVSLMTAGAVPNEAQLADYCADNPDDPLSCSGGPQKNDGDPPGSGGVVRTGGNPLPIPKAMVLLDPFAVLFTAHDLAKVGMPVLAIRPNDSRLGKQNLLALDAGLPAPPEIRHVPGGHFVFVDICPPAFKADAPMLCSDAAGVDRAAVHDAVNSWIADFFRRTL
ncbi:dienelactone hydrolase [Rhodospirillaceae bacterium KN72]|uniref:Dienelactone hydrolase n=1 Tax=Pacificispira spongiicola TaxID=2729598 RepID=A0A7Y0E0U5_9PROT|nr:dienelactone hydrolase [Pacificispira spongiicola]NMM45131.1 dienelactone hydrolase [Pacificispira spongiicola]